MLLTSMHGSSPVSPADVGIGIEACAFSSELRVGNASRNELSVGAFPERGRGGASDPGYCSLIGSGPSGTSMITRPFSMTTG